MRAALGLDVSHATALDAVRHHGYIQIDPINICGRMHDLILRNRVANYQEGDLMRLLHGEPDGPPLPANERVAFEHHVPGTGILVAFPLDAWPYLLHAMRHWSKARGAWSGRLTPREKILSEQLLAEIRTRGPLGSEDFEDVRRARKVWGQARLAKATLQKLFFHGRLLIAQRSNNRRRYDLPERVLPPPVLAQSEPSDEETARWLALLKLRQRRLATLKRDELRLLEGRVQPVAVEGCPTLYCLREDAALLEAGNAGATVSGIPTRASSRAVVELLPPVRLLAPLDPLIYDRRVTATLWDFEYTWEAYTPASKRVRGYYALPILSGTELVGHMDLKANRVERKLVVVSRHVRRGHKVAQTLRDFAKWLGLRAR
jgi:uncharacterized protein